MGKAGTIAGYSGGGKAQGLAAGGAKAAGGAAKVGFPCIAYAASGAAFAGGANGSMFVITGGSIGQTYANYHEKMISACNVVASETGEILLSGSSDNQVKLAAI